MVLLVFLVVERPAAEAVSPAGTGEVGTVRELQEAVGKLSDGGEIVLAPGVYQLTETLCIRADSVTLRGRKGAGAATVLLGPGMENSQYGAAPHAIWCASRDLRIADLTVRDFYLHGIMLNPGAQRPVIERVRFIDLGEQFVKASPVRYGVGVDEGVVRDSFFAYEKGPPRTDHGGGVGYTNAIDVHAGRNWVIQGNLFQSFHTDDRSDCRWNPAILMWNGAAETVVEGNVFVNVDRAVAFGLEQKPEGPDHAGGIIRQNLVLNAEGLFSPARKADSDALILVWNSPGTMVFANTLLTNGNQRMAIEFRYDSTGAWERNNLTDAPVGFRGP